MPAEPRHPEFDQEAQKRWGDSAAYRESTPRVERYRAGEWRAIHAEAEQIARDFAELLRMDEPATGERARAVAERHREHISRWFYPCSAEMHRKLGEMYATDNRFAANYERHADGLVAYVREAIEANAQDVPASSR